MRRRSVLLAVAVAAAGAYFARHESRRRTVEDGTVPRPADPVAREDAVPRVEPNRRPKSRRRLVVLAVVIAVACACAAGALAYWTSGSTSGSNGRSDIGSLGTGATPSASLVGRTATVSWAQTIVSGSPLGSLASGGYTVRRYAVSAPGTPITPGASCSGSITGAPDPLSCSESSLPTGRWLYTETPTYYLWTGGTSSQSTAVAVAPDAPVSVTLTNGGGTGNAFVNAANASSLSFDVVLPATSLASDTVHLAVGDGSSAVSATAAGIAGGGTRTFTGVNASTLADGTLTISAWATSSYGDAGATTSITRTKDTVRPALSTMVTGDTGGTTGKLDTVTVTFSETLAAYSAGTAPWTLANVPSGGSLSSVGVAGSTATLTVAEGAGAINTTVGSFTVALATNANGIRDPAGNLSFFAATAPTDGIAPVRTAMVMNDVDGDGKVDQVLVTFSETLASSTNTAQWSLASVPSGGTLSSVSTAAAVATLAIAEGAGAADTAVGSFTLALATSATGIRDAAGNQSSFAAAAPTDGAKPALVTMTMLDVNANGKVDRVTAVFSETLASYTAGNTPWTLANVPSGGTLASVAVATTTATLTITEGGGAANTAVGSFTVALATSATGIRDAAANLSSFGATVPADGAAPVRTAMVMQDVNANGKVDQVSVTFSEALVASTDTAPWTIANVPSGGTLSSVSTAGAVATLTLSEGAAAADTSLGSFTVALATSATGIRDAAANLSSFAAAAPTDGAKPVLVTLTMLDTNANGKVDRVTAVFSETLASYTAGNAPWTLANVPSGGTLASVAVATTTATLTITEGAGAANTAVGTFTVALATSATGIRDAAGNQSSFGATAPADGAAPVRTAMVMNDANANGKVDQVLVTFSETLASSTDTAPWTLANVPSGGTLSSVATAGAVATLTIAEGGGAANTAVGTFTVALAASATGIRDAAGNQSSFTAVGPSDGAKPILVTLTMLDNNTNGKVDRVTAVFSETLAASTATAPWTLANTPSGGTLLSVAVATTTATLTLTEGAGAANTAVGSFTVALATSATGIRDAAGNQSSFAATSPLDGAAPVPITIATSVPGTTAGMMQAGDALAITFSEAILASSVPGTTTITETDPTGGGNDTLTITSLTNGARALGANNYVNVNNTSASFGASTLGVAGATVTATVAGACTGTCGANLTAGQGAFVFAPAATITDAAGNAATGALTTAGTFRVF